MRNDYLEDRADADELIDEFGQDGVLRRLVTSGSDLDPVDEPPEDHPVVFAVLDYQNGEIDGTRILQADKKVYLAAGGLPIEPGTDDQLIVAGIRHAIIQVKPLAPAGTVVFWELQVRR